jgi:uncharacterized membrane protein YeaQ/YmgE (transglycosylase-associated protein family)
MMLTSIPEILVGIVLLIFGRKLFWLFVAAMGFIVGTEIATSLFEHQPGLILISALVLGLVGAIVALFLQKVAVGIGGFLAAGYFVMTVLSAWALQAPERAWISFLVGGVIGAVLMIYIFDWALIIFSSISGTHLIIHSFQMNQAMASALFVALVVVGILVQARLLARKADHLAP